MRKILSIFMLAVMLVLSAQPSIAMHFCRQDLNSISVIVLAEEKNCCKAEEHSHTSMPCHDEDGDNANINHAGCCDVKNYKLSTDRHFQASNFQIDFSKMSLALPSFWAGASHDINYINTDTWTADVESYPPEGLQKDNTNILKLICVYRI